MRAMQTQWIGVAIATAVLSLNGCGKKDEDCAAFLPAVTKEVATLKAAAAVAPAGGAKEKSAASVAVADAAEKFALDIAKKTPSTEELQKASGEYQALAKVIAAAARADADALDLIAALEAKTRPDAADGDVKQLNTDQDKLKKQCADHPATECKAIATAIAGTAAATKNPDQLEKIESTLAGIKVKDATLVAMVSSVRGSITGLAKTLHDAADAVIEMKSLATKRQGTKTDLDAALAKEAPITAGLTKFCASK
jgi:hypothetical protein